MGNKYLLVEGLADRDFFSACCRQVGLGKVQVKPPIDLGAKQGGKGNAISVLPVGGNLLDFNNGQAKGFIDWLSVPVKPFLQPRTQALDRANKFAPTLQNG
jgi:hypothetical protein